ncbi:DUF2938 domain-containing protein [Ferrovibrio terrae]|uniref:DUF2938 domain-containing protein n=1 Tax=Ferrovibrio terrae TaxID=2594003 RepID=A0A516H5S2_9PROT|nr:DUF2938 domain-containing protein [Ferrovibrio terrae]QDO99020.1 DUF2938 domain-containing protein [Ferrovibrio terrae]
MAETALRILLVGIGATLVMDLWGWLLRRVYGVSGLDYRMVGRWVGHMAHGQFRHDGIGRAAPVPAEALIGWGAHYAIGVVFAAVLVAAVGQGWLQAPMPMPALVFGLVSVALPYLVMQPAFGSGVAGARTPDPLATRLRSLITHLVFGCGLYLAACLLAAA